MSSLTYIGMDGHIAMAQVISCVPSFKSATCWRARHKAGMKLFVYIYTAVYGAFQVLQCFDTVV